MRVKKTKLAAQNDRIRESLRSRNSSMRTDIFKGISINVNGRTQPTADELKRLILLNGGEYHPYYRYQTTKFMIATNLSAARIKTLRPDDRIVKPQWITDSVQAKCLLPYQDYQLFADEPRGENGSVSAIEPSSSQSPGKKKQQQLQIEELLKPKPKPLPAPQIQNANQSNREREIVELDLDSSQDPEKCETVIPREEEDDQQTQIYAQKQQDSSTSHHQMPPKKELLQPKVKQRANHNSNQHNNNNSSNHNTTSKPITMSAFVIKGTKPSRFPTPKVPAQRKPVANICGKTSIDDIISLLNEWVGCPEGVTDEDTACVTKYFYDLMGEPNYHTKFYEIISAFQQRVIQYDERDWINLYNNLVSDLKNELNLNINASQNLYQVITLIELNETNNESSDAPD